MLILISSNDLFIMFLSVELQNLCFYILISLKRSSNLAIEAGLKYLILNGFSASLFGMGLSFIYCVSGTLNMATLIILVSNLHNELLGAAGLLFILISVLFKIAIFPFHYWIADIYEGSDLIVTTFFAIIPKIAALVLFIKLYIIFINYIINFNYILIIICVLSIIYSTIAALYQEKLKRLLAFAAIGHMSYIVLSISLNCMEGLVAAILYLIVYILLTINIFCILLSFKYFVPNNFGMLIKIIDVVRLLKNNWVLAFSFACSLMSMAGIPPFAGFFVKLLVFQTLLQTGNFVALIFLILISIMGALYYIRLIRFLYFNNIENMPYSFVLNLNSNKILYVLILVTFCINVIFLFLYSPFIQFIYQKLYV
jgi:NADH-quinone oxidoreductase subunit N